MSEKRLLLNGRILGRKGLMDGSLRLHNQRVVEMAPELTPQPGEEVVDCRGAILVPMVLDLHVHGGGCHLLHSDNPEVLHQACKAQFLNGTGWLLATFPLAPIKSWCKGLEAVEEAMAQQRRGASAEAKLLGAYLEGPFLNPDMSGGMKKKYIAQWSFNSFRKVVEAFAGTVKIVTLAPEHPSAEDVLSLAKELGFKVFLGHSMASFEGTQRAIELGAAGFTHLFNAMAQYHHRQPGIVGAALLSSLPCEMIPEPAHLHPASWELALRMKGYGKIIPISDGSLLACCQKERYSWGKIHLIRQGTASLNPEGKLYGTAISLLQGLAILHKRGLVPIEKGIRMATKNPAAFLGKRIPSYLSTGHRGPVAMVEIDQDLPQVRVFS